MAQEGAARQRARQKALQLYLQHADGLLYDYLSSIRSLRSLAGEAVNQSRSHLTIKDIDRRFAKAAQKATTRRVAPGASSAGGQAIDEEDPVFRTALRMTQNELRARIDRLSAEEPKFVTPAPRTLEVLDAEPGRLRGLFGSLTHGWDTLVEIKLLAQEPDARRRAIDAWLVALVSECERLIRDFVTLALATDGSDVDTVLDLLFAAGSMGVSMPSPSRLIEHERTLDALVAAVASSTEQGSAQTMTAAGAMADALQFSLFPQTPIDEDGAPLDPGECANFPLADGRTCPGLDPGFPDLLAWLTPDLDRPSAEQLWNRLVALRRRTIHGPADLPRLDGSRPAREQSPIYECGVDQLELVTDFIGALGLRYGFMLTTNLARQHALATPLRGGKPSQAGALQRKLVAEFRVVSKSLLEEQRYALAWAVCEMAIYLEGGREHAPMLALNSFFARQELSRPVENQERFMSRAEIEAFDVTGQATRYQLLKQALLHDYKGIDGLLNRVVHDERNMTLEEVDSWPALAELRKTVEYKMWRKSQPEVR